MKTTNKILIPGTLWKSKSDILLLAWQAEKEISIWTPPDVWVLVVEVLPGITGFRPGILSVTFLTPTAILEVATSEEAWCKQFDKREMNEQHPKS